eukprot:TRINITY_DN26190_c0_g1_i1.p1 TRINITY_DN26190_c0_g1~~TRINITY_DN26190_c0_g1_i1.p1  ORF type:complete len:106 (+),score=16.39 TRINITY_DN26190_c0_g1_i1:207-524(+)
MMNEKGELGYVGGVVLIHGCVTESASHVSVAVFVEKDHVGSVLLETLDVSLLERFSLTVGDLDLSLLLRDEGLQTCRVIREIKSGLWCLELDVDILVKELLRDGY